MKGCTISGLCRLVGISRQGYYRLRKVRERQQVDEDLVVQLVRGERALHPRMGARKLHLELKESLVQAGVDLGRDRFSDILKRADLLVERKKNSIRTTFSNHTLPVYRNLLYDLEPTASNQVWVSDITYICTDKGFLYLALVTDLYSRKIVGWHLGESLEATECLKALQMAIEQLPAHRWPIHHSDRGSQYCCHLYVQALQERGLPISMTEKNHCYENCYAERVNGILKDEYNLDLGFRNKKHAQLAVAQSIDLYNNHRPHGSIGMRKPAQFHRAAA